MDFVSEIRDATLDAASAIGYAAKGMGEKMSAYAGELGDQMHILGSNVSHGLSVAAGDLGNSVANVTGNITRGVSSILAKAFNDFVRLINACETHEEEDIVIQAELGNLKRKFKEKDLRGNELRETLIRMVYCEMLGYEAPFGYLKAIELCSDPNIINKKAGYITAALCIPPEHEFRFMIVNRLQMDLQSKNYLEVATALIATSELLTVDMIPALVHLVYQALQHKEATVLTKAIMLLQRFHQLDPSSVTDMAEELRRLIKSYNVTILFACISVLHDYVLEDPASFKDLVPFFSDMLIKIVNNKFDHAYDFDSLPAPWIQMKIIRILAALGESDQTASESMYVAILSAMRTADRVFPHHLSCAISADCVHAIIRIYPNDDLLEEAASIIDRMVNSRDANLKYLGLRCMAEMIELYPQHVIRMQMVVLNSLESEDVTIRNSTLQILHRMCNSQNVDVIIKRFLAALSNTYDRYQRQQLVDDICDVAERFAPNSAWYIDTMTEVFRLGGKQVNPAMEGNLIRLLSESQGDVAADTQLRCQAISQLFPLAQDPMAHENLVRIATWIMGEFGHLCETPSLSEQVDLLGDIWGRPGLSVETKSYLVSAFMKVSAQTQTIPAMASVIVRECMRSRDTQLVQQAMEFREMCKSGSQVFLAAIPEDHEGPLIVDEKMSFLDNYVMQGRLSGMQDYQQHELSDEEEAGLKTEAYEAPEPVVAKPEPAAVRPPEKKDEFIDFSAVKGSFGFKPAVQEKKEEPKPEAAAMFAGVAAEAEKEAESEENEPDERELEAAALFSGVATKPAKKAVKKEAKVVLNPAANALFAAPSSTGFFKPTQQIPQQIPKPQPKPRPQQQTIPQQQTTQQQQTIPQQPTIPQQQPTPQQPIPQPQPEEMGDILDFSAPAAETKEHIDMLQCKLSNTYKIFLKDPAGEMKLLANDEILHLSYYFIYRDASLVICIFAKSARDIHDVVISTHYTEGLAVKYVTEPKGAIEGKTIKLQNVAKEEQITILGSTNFQKPTPSSDLELGGEITYKVNGDLEKTLKFEIPFNFVEMIRETPMSTSEYFNLWKTTKAEQKIDVKTTLRNAKLFAEKANRIFHVAVIDLNEVSRTTLMAGKVAGTTSTCLMEINMTATGSTIFFKTPSAVLCRLLVDAAKVFEDQK